MQGFSKYDAEMCKTYVTFILNPMTPKPMGTIYKSQVKILPKFDLNCCRCCFVTVRK